jgi:hypothetical protein
VDLVGLAKIDGLDTERFGGLQTHLRQTCKRAAGKPGSKKLRARSARETPRESWRTRSTGEGGTDLHTRTGEAGAPCSQSAGSQGQMGCRTAPAQNLRSHPGAPVSPYLVNLTVNGAVVCSIACPARFNAVW